ncbi:DUF2971 domain-containing protein [Nitrosomonas sp. Is35]|uniref:DUF2971 domain-containing protein n=1 Tax=Nitrosomonas sp. Is35 TaxID=3080534 RepID=UPI00294B4D70|nr:DUF2971 domain-containing protein [Nitrosomonas sp. Is35]MDV6346431.1 DUF2971 domain-containing protein [Nitrosomonas sp. Is35]
MHFVYQCLLVAGNLLMIIYHFTSSEFALRALRDRRLKIARINELSDPFQLCAADFSGSDTQPKLEAFRNQMNEGYGVICLTEHYRDPVLWSHYADGHRGVALVFEIPDDMAIRVSYQPEHVKLDVDAAWQRGGFTESDLTQLISIKFSSWQYESEVRMMCRLNDHFCQIDSKGIKVYFESLSLESYGVDALKLIGLIRGVRCDLKPADIASELLAVDTLPVQDARLDVSSFQIVAGETYPVNGVRSFSACCFRV